MKIRVLKTCYIDNMYLEEGTIREVPDNFPTDNKYIEVIGEVKEVEEKVEKVTRKGKNAS